MRKNLFQERIIAVMRDGKARISRDVCELIGLDVEDILVRKSISEAMGRIAAKGIFIIEHKQSGYLGFVYKFSQEGYDAALSHHEAMKQKRRENPPTPRSLPNSMSERCMTIIDQHKNVTIPMVAELMGITSKQASQVICVLCRTKRVGRIYGVSPATYRSIEDDDFEEPQATIPGARIVRFSSRPRPGEYLYKPMPGQLFKQNFGMSALEFSEQ